MYLNQHHSNLLLKKCKEEVIRVLGAESDEDKEDSSKSNKLLLKIKGTHRTSANKDNSIPVTLQEMDKKTLIELSKTLELEVEIKNTTNLLKLEQ